MRHLGAGWADEGLDVAWLIGCHVLGRGLAEKGSQKAWRAKRFFDIFPMFFFDDVHRFLVVRGLAAKEP